MKFTANRNWRIVGACSAMLLCAAIWLLWFRTTRASAGVNVAFGPAGMSSLKYQGRELLDYGDFRVDRVVMKDKAGSLFDGDLTATVRMDSKRGELKRIYTWGSVQVDYSWSPDRLNLIITTKNISPFSIESLFYEPLAFKFPVKPSEYDGSIPLLGHNVGGPTAVPLSYGSGVVLLVNEDMRKPLLIGFPWALNRPISTIFPLKVNTGRNTMYPDSLPLIARPIGPSESDQFHLSLRFGPAGAKALSLAADTGKKFADAFPPTLKWDDRRPIGSIFLATSAAGWDTNPRGWLQDSKVDITTKAGLEIFRNRITAYADESIDVLRGMNAQGMIAWDVEGEEFKHPTTYIGDPRLLPALAPEMNDLADHFFARFRNAGFRVGVCVRPQTFTSNPGHTPEQRESVDPTKTLIEKIAYARKRWGATLFYVDSNGDPNSPTDPEILRKVAAHFPDVLLIPEHANLQYYAYTAPFHQLRQDSAGTTERVRNFYPRAFSIINTTDGPIDRRYKELVAAVSSGDLLMYRTWYKDPANAKVKTIYQASQASVLDVFRPFSVASLMSYPPSFPPTDGLARK